MIFLNFKNIPCYVTSEVSLNKFYFALFDDGLTLKTLKLVAFIGFCIKTLHTIYVAQTQSRFVSVTVNSSKYFRIFKLLQIFLLSSVLLNLALDPRGTGSEQKGIPLFMTSHLEPLLRIQLELFVIEHNTRQKEHHNQMHTFSTHFGVRALLAL